MRILIAIAAAILFSAGNLFAESSSSGDGAFCSSPQVVSGFSLSGVDSLGLEIRFRAAETFDWCCAYAIRGSKGDAAMVCMVILLADVADLNKRSIGFRYSIENGRTVTLSLHTLDGDTTTADVASKFGTDDPDGFSVKVHGNESKQYAFSDGSVFLISNVGKTTVNQLDVTPKSVSDEDVVQLAMRVVERNSKANKAEQSIEPKPTAQSN